MDYAVFRDFQINHINRVLEDAVDNTPTDEQCLYVTTDRLGEDRNRLVLRDVHTGEFVGYLQAP